MLSPTQPPDERSGRQTPGDALFGLQTLAAEIRISSRVLRYAASAWTRQSPPLPALAIRRTAAAFARATVFNRSSVR